MARQFSLFLLLYVILLLAHLDYLPRRILSASLASTRYFLRPFLGWVLQTRLFPSDPSRRKADFDAYLVLHIETTLGPPETTIGYPNEIIEWSVVLLRWADKRRDGTASKLKVIDEYNSVIKPTWNPTLTKECTSLTGVTQEDIDDAPTFKDIMDDFRKWLEYHAIVNPHTGWPQVPCCLCSERITIRDQLAKQLFISRMELPPYLLMRAPGQTSRGFLHFHDYVWSRWQESALAQEMPRPDWLATEQQLQVMGLELWEGARDHGIDKARNSARVLMALIKSGTQMKAYCDIIDLRNKPRWPWMGRRGKVLEDLIGAS